MIDPWELLQTDDELVAEERANPPAEIAALHIVTLGGQLDVDDAGAASRDARFFADEDTGGPQTPVPEVEEDLQAVLERQHYAAPVAPRES
jgi:hypothetical protein